MRNKKTAKYQQHFAFCKSAQAVATDLFHLPHSEVHLPPHHLLLQELPDLLDLPVPLRLLGLVLRLLSLSQKSNFLN